ncbi:MAG: glycosyltransferase [Solirubrobacterales bacterium]|nr:glycosyltransferase [Solirubrobacterales bacterium]
MDATGSITPERFVIAQVSPYPWESDDGVSEIVRGLSDSLAGRGHRVVVLTTTESKGLVRDTRRALREARDDPAALLARAQGEPLVLGVGEMLPLPSGTRRRPRGLPVDVARTIEEALTLLPLDFVHVHEPFAPSTSSAALRHSRALNVGSFHASTERILSTQIGRKVVELVFGRLDARTASFEATRDLMTKFFPADYRVIGPGVPAGLGSTRVPGRPRVVFVVGEERAALRLFMRSVRRLPDSGWDVTVWSPAGFATTPTLRRELRERVTFSGPHEASEAEVLASADIVVCASSGVGASPGLLLRAIAAGAVPVVARVAVYEEILARDDLGLLFEIGDVEILTAQIQRLLSDPQLLRQMAAAVGASNTTPSWEAVGAEFEVLYSQLAARRHSTHGNPEIRKRLADRPLIDVDLHMHTDHSKDCATPVEVLLGTAKAQGLGAIAITDHNEISGALDALQKADGIKVIVAEEVKTASQGEVIGLFLTEKIERGMTLEETIAEIKRQGGLVYVPHPFDRMHSVPDYEHLLAVLDDIDAIEIFNPRIAFKPFNDEAVRFAAKYRIVAGAGSDSHVAQGLGSVRIRMRDFDGPQEFLESLREADIIRRPTSLLFVQALKFIETKATPAGARKARRERRVRKAARKS